MAICVILLFISSLWTYPGLRILTRGDFAIVFTILNQCYQIGLKDKRIFQTQEAKAHAVSGLPLDLGRKNMQRGFLPGREGLHVLVISGWIPF
jgi:hypothetical protein